jgi:tRNA 2-selenouridine synthase
VSIRRLPILEFLSASTNAVLIDVRSPSEFNHAHIPGAVSIPLFTDEERKIVGTAYKQESRETAIKIGLDFFGPKMRRIVEQVEELVKNEKAKVNNEATEQLQTSNLKPQTINLYCWRGGMRSGAIAWLLDLYGFKVSVLAGGYKAYRNWALKTFEAPYNFKILGGFTGSGKTETLNALGKKGERIIDLEGIAKHKGSAFGNINMPEQPTQEMFENLLATELVNGQWSMVNGGDPGILKKNGLPATEEFEINIPDSSFTIDLPIAIGTPLTIWLEDESQRIGKINLPNAFWKTMRESPIYFLDIPFEERLEHIVEEYGSLNKEKLADAIMRISKRLGGVDTKLCLQYLEEGDIKACFSILLKYYDKHYLKALNNRERIQDLLIKIACEKVSPANANLLTPILHEKA